MSNSSVRMLAAIASEARPDLQAAIERFLSSVPPERQSSESLVAFLQGSGLTREQAEALEAARAALHILDPEPLGPTQILDSVEDLTLKLARQRGPRRRKSPLRRATDNEPGPRPASIKLIAILGAAFVLILTLLTLSLRARRGPDVSLASARAALDSGALAEAHAALPQRLDAAGEALRERIVERSAAAARQTGADLDALIAAGEAERARERLRAARPGLIPEHRAALAEALEPRLEAVRRRASIEAALSAGQDQRALTAAARAGPLPPSLAAAIEAARGRVVEAALSDVIAAAAAGDAEAARGALRRAEEAGGGEAGLGAARRDLAAITEARVELAADRPERALAVLEGVADSSEAVAALRGRAFEALAEKVTRAWTREGPEPAWKRLAAAGAAAENSARLAALRSALIEALRQRDRAGIEGLIAAGRGDEARAALAALARRPWAPEARALDRMRAALTAREGAARRADEDRRFAAMLVELRGAYRRRDLATVDRLLAAAWTEPDLRARVRIEQRVRGAFAELLAASVEGLRARRGQDLRVRVGASEVRGRLDGVTEEGITLRIGQGRAEYRLKDLAWTELLRFARGALELERAAFLEAVARYARGEEAVAALRAHRLESLARDLLASLGEELEAPSAGKAPTAMRDAFRRSQSPPSFKAAEAHAEILALARRSAYLAAEGRAAALVKSEPAWAEARALRGRLALVNGRWDLARRAYRKAVSLDESWGEAADNAAVIEDLLRGEDARALSGLASLKRRSAWTRPLASFLRPAGLEAVSPRSGRAILYTRAETLAPGLAAELVAEIEAVIDALYRRFAPADRKRRPVFRFYLFSSAARSEAFMRSAGFAPRPNPIVPLHDWRSALLQSRGSASSAVPYNLRENVLAAAGDLFLDASFGRLPFWLRRGLAIDCGAAAFDGKRARFGRVAKGSQVDVYSELMRVAVGKDSLITLTGLEALLRSEGGALAEVGGEANLITDAQAWSLVHTLLYSREFRKGEQLIKAYLEAFTNKGSEAEAFAATFAKIDLAKLELAWRRHALTL